MPHIAHCTLKICQLSISYTMHYEITSSNNETQYIWIFKDMPLYFLGVFTKLWKETISFIMSIHLSSWNTQLPLDGFSSNLIYEYFSKIC